MNIVVVSALKSNITAMRPIWICPDCLTTNYEINVMDYILFLINFKSESIMCKRVYHK